MIILTSLISIGIVYYFHETGVIFAFCVAFIMEVLFLLYAFNYLKEIDLKNKSIVSHNKNNFKNKEKILTDENTELQNRLELINRQLTEHNMQDLVQFKNDDLPERTEGNK